MQKVLLIIPKIIPSSSIGCITPLLELHNSGEVQFRMQYEFRVREKNVEWADTIVLCRAIEPRWLGVLSWIKKHNKRLIYDIDDNFFELPLEDAGARYCRAPWHLATINLIFSQADAVRTYSKPMYARAKEYNNNVQLLNSYFRRELIDGLSRSQHKAIRIVYATSRTTDDVLQALFIEAIRRILQEYEERVEFYVYGKIPKELQRYSNVHVCKYELNYSQYIRSFFQMGFDIGLAPVEDTIVCNSKTNNKFREYGGMGVCGVYSNTELYRSCVDNRETGMLVENTEESWYQGIKDLIEDEELRDRIQSSAKEKVYRDYSLENTIKDWSTMLSLENNNKPFFCNYRKLRYLTAIENNSLGAKIRSTPFVIFASQNGLKKYQVEISEIEQQLGKDDYDCLIIFVNNVSRKLIKQLDRLREFQKTIIIDSYIQTEEKSDNTVIYTNVLGKALIGTIKGIENNQIMSQESVFTLSELFDEKQEALVKKIGEINRKQLETDYSINSPCYEWSVLLSQIDAGEKEDEKRLLVKIRRAIGRTVNNRFVRRIRTSYEKKKRRAELLNQMTKDYWKINYKHRY